MPVMSSIESAFCRSAAWELFARRTVLPLALDGHQHTCARPSAGNREYSRATTQEGITS
jgi:hypothetical protein